MTTYAFICLVTVILCLARPYGSPEFQVLSWWPPVAALAVVVVIFAYKLRPPAKAFSLLGASFALSVIITSMVSDRNVLFIAEADGVVVHRYIGGHALKSIEVREPDGVFHRIEGLPEIVWNTIQPGQHAVKDRKSFEIVIGGRRTTLVQWAKVWKTESQLKGEQTAGGATPEPQQPPR
ncbi:MAG: hypothetical protein V4675_11940 [Verrucomicrobiota bacterium]